MKKRNTTSLLFFCLLGASFLSCSTLKERPGDQSLERRPEYVLAVRAYDLLYEQDGCGEESFTIDVFPGLEFKSYTSGAYVYVDGNEELQNMQSIYICDFNNDGNMDIGYSTMIAKTSSLDSGLRSFIYDLENETYIYDSGTESSFVLDIDDDGRLVVEEMCGDNINGWGFSQLARAGRFLFGSGQIEWFNMDFKVKSVYMDGRYYSVSDKSFIFPLNTECMIRIDVFCIGKDNVLKDDSLKIETDYGDFSYRAELSESSKGATMYYLYCQSAEEASFNLKVTINGVSCSKNVSFKKNS